MGILDIYLPIAGVSLDVMALLILGAAVGVLSGRVRRRRRLSPDAAAHLHRRAAGGGGRFLGQSTRRRLGLGRDRALAARQYRFPDGWADAHRRLRRLGARGLALRHPAPAWATSSSSSRLSYARCCRRSAPDADREHRAAWLRRRRRDRSPPQAASAHLAARLALQAALSPLETLYQRAVAAVILGFCVGILSAVLGVGGGFVMVPAMIYLLRHADRGRAGHVAVSDHLRHCRRDLCCRRREQHRRCRPGDGAADRRRVGAQLGTRWGAKLRGEELRALLALIVLVGRGEAGLRSDGAARQSLLARDARVMRRCLLVFAFLVARWRVVHRRAPISHCSPI